MLPMASAIWPIRSETVGCTSEHFDNVIRDSLGKSQRKRSTHGRLRRPPRGILNDMLAPDEVEKRERGIAFNLDKNVDVAVRTVVAAHARTEDGKPRHA